MIVRIKAFWLEIPILQSHCRRFTAWCRFRPRWRDHPGSQGRGGGRGQGARARLRDLRSFGEETGGVKQRENQWLNDGVSI